MATHPARRRDSLESFYALDAVTQEAIWILGPLIVAASVALASPEVAVLLCAAISATGTLVFCANPASRAWRPDGVARQRGGALASGGLRVLLCSIVLTGCAWGCLSVGIPALAVHLGSAQDAGILLTLTSVGSLAGGLAYGGRAWAAPLERRYAALLAGIAVSALPLVLVDDLRLAAPLAAVLGLAWAPTMSCQYALSGAPRRPAASPRPSRGTRPPSSAAPRWVRPSRAPSRSPPGRARRSRSSAAARSRPRRSP